MSSSARHEEVLRHNRAALAKGRSELICPRCARVLPNPVPADYAVVKRSGPGWCCSSCGDVWDLDGQPSKAEASS